MRASYRINCVGEQLPKFTVRFTGTLEVTCSIWFRKLLGAVRNQKT